MEKKHVMQNRQFWFRQLLRAACATLRAPAFNLRGACARLTRPYAHQRFQQLFFLLTPALSRCLRHLAPAMLLSSHVCPKLTQGFRRAYAILAPLARLHNNAYAMLTRGLRDLPPDVLSTFAQHCSAYADHFSYAY